MTDQTQGFSIGTLSRMTGVSSHVLRKWESRYAIIQPERTASGRRRYSREDVERIRLIKRLINQGHGVGTLAGHSYLELEKLAQTTDVAAVDPHLPRVTVSGTGLAAMIASKRQAFPAGIDFMLVGDDPLALPAGAAESILLTELPNLGVEIANKLAALTGFARKIVVYSFANQKTLQSLERAGVICLKHPASAEDICRHLEPVVASANVTTLRPPPPQRFSSATVARVSNASPAIECECPKHIAELLALITAFEQYSKDCETEQPDDRELHSYLGVIAGHSRSFFEDALARVAKAEGFDLGED